jgi:hypothetical protein
MANLNIQQRDVYLLPHPINSSEGQHPFIVLSIDSANNHEDTFIAVMITSSEIHYDDYSFDLLDEMFEKPLDKENSHVRMHLFNLCLPKEVIGKRINKIKIKYFKELMKSIGDLVFNFNFSPNVD